MFGIKRLRKWCEAEVRSVFDYCNAALNRIYATEADVEDVERKVKLLTEELREERRNRHNAFDAICKHLDIMMTYDVESGKHNVVERRQKKKNNAKWKI